MDEQQKVTIDQFKQLELRIGTIVEAEDHPQADRLYVLKVRMGERVKQLVAGIRGSYDKESLIGKQVVVCDNLEPALLRGVESQGMLLAASDQDGIAVLSPDRIVAEGSRVK